MNLAFNYNNWAFWDTYPNQKVSFDGPAKIIYVSKGVTVLNVNIDVYSAWKEWNIASLEAPSALAYEKALTVLGGDPITESQSVGVTYFLENGWRIQPIPSEESYVLTVNGNIYTRETGGNPFLFAQGVSVSLVRSNIVDLITVQSLGVTITEADIAAIAVASGNVAATKVWDETLSSHIISGSTGHKLGKIATKLQDIALK